MLTFFQYFSYSTNFTGILQYSARRRRRRNNLHASLKHKPTRRKCTGSRGRQVMSLIKIFPVSIRILFVFVRRSDDQFRFLYVGIHLSLSLSLSRNFVTINDLSSHDSTIVTIPSPDMF